MSRTHPSHRARFTAHDALLLPFVLLLLALSISSCAEYPTSVRGTDEERAPLDPAATGAELPVSECDAMRSEWLWCDDFEVDRLDGYFGYNDAWGRFTRDEGVGVAGGHGMRARWSEGQVSVGTLQLAVGRNPAAGVNGNVQGDPEAEHRELYWRMYVRTQPGWTGGAGHKLNRATILAGGNWEQAMIAHVWGGEQSELVIDPASGTDSSGNLQSTTYNDWDNLRWLGLVRGRTPIFEDARAGQWQCVEARARLNDAGQANGIFQMWVNGVLEAERTDFNWVGSYDSYGINAVFFENYWNGGSPQAQERYMDNIVVSTARIGCLDEGEPPADDPEDADSTDPDGDGTENEFDASGLTRITSHAFDAMDGDGWGYNSSSNYSIVGDATARMSPDNVGQARYPAGFSGGSGPATTWKSFGSDGYTELRVVQWIKVSENFYGHPSSHVNKVLHIWLDGRNRIYTAMMGGGTGALRPQVRLQAVNEPDEAGRLNLGQNVDTGTPFTFRRGEWHRWEFYFRSNTGGGNNGVVKMWVDGVLLAEYDDVNFVSSSQNRHFEHVYWAPTWGGTGETVPETMYMWTDDLGAFGGNGTGGGGSLPEEPTGGDPDEDPQDPEPEDPDPEDPFDPDPKDEDDGEPDDESDEGDADEEEPEKKKGWQKEDFPGKRRGS